MKGWIMLHRTLLNNPLWKSEKFTKAQAWIDLLLKANHTSSMVFLNGFQINLSPGQLCYSQESLSEDWKWNRKTVKKFLNFLIKRNMIRYKVNTRTTVITIVNWNKYQADGRQYTRQYGSLKDTDNNEENNNNDDTSDFGQFDLLSYLKKLDQSEDDFGKYL